MTTRLYIRKPVADIGIGVIFGNYPVFEGSSPIMVLNVEPGSDIRRKMHSISFIYPFRYPVEIGYRFLTSPCYFHYNSWHLIQPLFQPICRKGFFGHILSVHIQCGFISQPSVGSSNTTSIQRPCTRSRAFSTRTPLSIESYFNLVTACTPVFKNL